MRLKAEISSLPMIKNSISSELIPKNSSQFNVKSYEISKEFMHIFTVNCEEFFGMSSDDVKFFTINKYDVSAFKRTVKHEFLTVSTPSLDLKMYKM